MVDDFTNYAGIILSQAGSSDQYWHRDTHTLSNTRTDGKELILLDDFYFTVLIPITVPFTIENGATEFLIGSHRLSADQFANGATVQMEVPLGSALVFNGKISHRGKANFSDRDRPALYLVYHKKWYNDQFRKGIP
jgi:ectoine hydroxylase-related dioxygenase (phytanoyl-CoA dioxygenase family)